MIRYEVEPVEAFVFRHPPSVSHHQGRVMLRLLGTPRLEPGPEHDHERLEIPPTKPAALLLHLACVGDWVSRETLASLFAPDGDETSVRHHLRVLLNRARQFGWSDPLEVEATRLRFAIQNDVCAFREAIGRGDWAQAVSLHQRPLLDGFQAGAPGFEAWLETERDGLAHAWREAALRHARELTGRLEPASAMQLLAKVLEHDDLAEDVLAAYLEAAYLAGQRDEALLAYARFRQHLRQELDLEPLETTRHLAETIRRAEPLSTAPSPQALKPSVPLTVQRPPALVGRDAERAILHDPQARLVLIAGEPGAGKTRLMTEAIPGARWLRCREGLDGVPYQPVLEFVRANLNRLPELGPYREDLARLIPELMPGATIGPAEPQSAKPRLLEALARTLEAAGTPIAADDLQWADAATLELLVFLAARGQVRLVCAYRSTEVTLNLRNALESLRSNPAFEIRLRALRQEDIRALLAHLIGLDVGPERFSNWLTGKSGGNVFFALEILRALFETGVLEERDGVWHTALDEITRDYSELEVPGFEVPGRVAQVVERRVLRLSESTRRVLQAASVIRAGFTPKLLSNVAGLSEFAVLDALEEAEGAGLVTGARFHHDLTRQSVYGGLTDARRRVLHLRVAQGLEGSAEPLELAGHWLEAGESGRAFTHLLEAANCYRERGLLEESRQTLERALPHAPTLTAKLEVQQELAWVQFYLSNTFEAEELIEPVLARMDDPEIHPDICPEIRAGALNLRAELLLYGGHVALAGVVNAQALEAGKQAGLDCSNLRVTGAHIAQTAGRFEQAIALLEPVVAHWRTREPGECLASALISLGSAYNELGDYEAGARLNGEGLGIARAIGARHRQVNAALNLAYALARLERVEEAIHVQEDALKLGEFTNTATLRNNLAADYLRLGRTDEARWLCEALSKQGNDPTLQCISWARLGKIYAQLGLETEKTQALEHGLALLDQTEYEVALVGVTIAVLDHGTDAQVARLMPSLHGRRFANPYAQRRFEQALERRVGQGHD